ncbi:MAG: MFS transporter [Ignavibacteriaceae bacterium]|nr:MFS transporter [Ignavibacteriaceae bacterium]
MGTTIVSLFLAGIVILYFYNNPLKHGRWFMIRRFINWFPLGMTYAFLYMGRYNLNVSKNALGSLMTKEEFGIIFAAGTITYALSFLINGPLVDKIGGKKGIIIAAVGSSVANILLGVLTYLVVTGQLQMKMVVAFSILYSINMYFQSYGAVSIIKVKAYWFHVRERGVFGAIFGTLISFGVYFAFDWGQAIVDMVQVKANGTQTWLGSLIKSTFALESGSTDAIWAVFFIPAIILIFWAIMDFFMIKDSPEEANFPHFDTHDASSGQMHIDFTAMQLLKRVFSSPIMLTIAFIELTSGVLRNGIMQWYFIFAKEVKQPGAEFFLENWGLLLCVFGIIGGFMGGMISDKYFHSRRSPPVVFLSAFMFIMALLMAIFLTSSPIIVGSAAVLISMAVIGVHSLMSGTAAADFGGRKATATSSGIVDGFVYLGTGIQSFSLGFLTSWNWQWWPIFLMPFALLGMYLALRIWKELPAATQKYIDEVENNVERVGK